MLNDNLVIGAFRYYLGRQTYAVSDFCLYAQENLKYISESSRRLMRKELKQEIERDNEARELHDIKALHFFPLGSDWDRKMWVELYENLKGYDNVY